MPLFLPRALLQPRRIALAAALCLASAVAVAQGTPLAQRLAEIREINKYVPERALPMLQAMEREARAAALPERIEFLNQLSQAHDGLGQNREAAALADELVNIGRQHDSKVALAKGTLRKGYMAFHQQDLATSHRLIWEAEKLAQQTSDTELRVRTMISSGESFAEEGNFPAALERLQAAAAFARQHRDPTQIVMALNALIRLYGQMREHAKGFGILEEALETAKQGASPGRTATLKHAEYGLAIDSGQNERALNALLDSLAIERRIGATSMIARTLINLSDCYLKLRDYPNAARYGELAVAASRAQNHAGREATARLNLGQAYLATGRLLEGKRHIEAGMKAYDNLGDKPELQLVLVEYGQALERAGDLAGALTAYHREREISNELFEKRRQRAVLDLQEKYETEKKQRRIELLSTEAEVNRLQQRVWWLLAAVFGLASIVVGLLYRKVRHANAALYEKNKELKQQSVRDPLTGLYNRRHFLDYMRNAPQPELAAKGDQCGALFLLDVDHFKNINDTYGHAAGDAVLTAISASLGEILRETDMIVRWGGEEFLAFLPALPRGGLDEVAQRILNGISAVSIEHGGHTLAVNVSIGYAPFPLSCGGQVLPWERTVNVVDMALYLAKAHGRNRAYGVQGFGDPAQVCIDEIEKNLERAWRAGQVHLSVVRGNVLEQRASA
ncbi:tetratricopeptide repeat-containing diguanylate cyclase [Massilia yuzhufengensis]|uniref:diguanylate cyclase n=1 Tax=Massilia yuzhufengensis TaxID=1164594 RepID=A0A1I1IB74_9BURK|nr:GGDEF domain-containing protein [Massilia yuzhufengensis]SFC33467.1 diguanylate cyclase (GGDEF) domain-containing protein [Massilia yuzhufengensis]